MANLDIEPVNRVRFVWFGAEEAGLVGSAFYVGQLDKRALKDIAVMLNFDMVGSRNPGWFVYDGDASDTASTGSTGSGVVEDIFMSFFDVDRSPDRADSVRRPLGLRRIRRSRREQAVCLAGLRRTSRPQLRPQSGAVPRGPLSTPATTQACDTFTNVDLTALDEMTDAIAHGILTFAMTQSAVQGTDQGNDKATKYAPTFRGSRAIK